MPDFGLAQGLAVKMPYEQMIGNMRYNQIMRQQAQDRAEQRAKMFADDMDYNNAMNAYDHEIVKNYSTQKIKELGDWTRKNPNWKTDPNLRLEYNMRIKELKDNPYLNTGLAVDNSINAYKKFMSNPKNADILDLPEMTKYKTDLENYLHSGSIDGNTANRKLFNFVPPNENDLTDIYKLYGSAAHHTMVGSNVVAKGVKQDKYSVTAADVQNQINALKQNEYHNRRALAQYKNQLSKTPDSKLTYDQFLFNNLKGFVPEDKYDKYNYHVDSEKGGIGGSGKQKMPPHNNYATLLQDASKSGTAQASPDGLFSLLADKNKNVDLNNSYILVPDANGQIHDFKPFNGGITKNYTFSNGSVRMIKRGNGSAQPFAEFDVEMPVKQFESVMGDFIDEPNLPFGLGGDSEVRAKYQHLPIQIKKNDDGNEVVSFRVSKPIYADENSANTYNYGAHGKAQEYDTSMWEEKPTVSVKSLISQYGEDGARQIIEARKDLVNFVE